MANSLISQYYLVLKPVRTRTASYQGPAAVKNAFLSGRPFVIDQYNCDYTQPRQPNGKCTYHKPRAVNVHCFAPGVMVVLRFNNDHLSTTCQVPRQRPILQGSSGLKRLFVLPSRRLGSQICPRSQTCPVPAPRPNNWKATGVYGSIAS